jgi:hypothetical protein
LGATLDHVGADPYGLAGLEIGCHVVECHASVSFELRLVYRVSGGSDRLQCTVPLLSQRERVAGVARAGSWRGR